LTPVPLSLQEIVDDEPVSCVILSKATLIRPEIFSEGRPIANAEVPASSISFHFQHALPEGHIVLFYRGLVSTERITPIPGGELGYIDEEADAVNISSLPIGQVFHWPKDKVNFDMPEDFQADLQAPLPSLDAEDFEDGSDDSVTKTVRSNTKNARRAMKERHSKDHYIEVFTTGEIVAVKLPVGTRTSTDNKRIYARVLAAPHDHRYQLQTVWGVVDRLFPVKDLVRVPLSVAASYDIQGPAKKLSLKKVAEHASTSERVVISCKCKGLCYNKRCNCFKNQVKCSVHCHSDAEHDCGFLASLVLRTEIGLGEKSIEKEKEIAKGCSKRLRSNTEGEYLDR
jgi:hypothetical protein